MEKLKLIESQAYEAVDELLDIAKVARGGILVIGCSTSEVCGGVIGKSSSPDTANALFDGISRAAEKHGVWIAAQCCEHLNRAIVVEREAISAGIACGVISPVNAVPQPKAGGSFASCAYKKFSSPVVLEHISADVGLDIGGTLIGMHLKEVAVPVRLGINRIGDAIILAARTRAKFIGGSRAVYDDNIG